MGVLLAIFLIVMGGMAVPAELSQRFAGAKPLVEAAQPYTSWVGFVGCLFGALVTLVTFLQVLGMMPLLWLTHMVAGLVMFGLGLLLGFVPLSQRLLIHSSQVFRRGESLRDHLAAYQIPLGYGAIALGAWNVLAMILV